MMNVESIAYARAGLIGNPSDGYYGKTISISIRNFCARVSLTEHSHLEIRPCFQDRSRYESIGELVQDVARQGYYGGVRLMKATVKRFSGYCRARDISLHGRNFSLEYESNIPRHVGLAGSSALVTAALRCLMKFYEVEIPKAEQPNLILSVENDELGIAAGLQDRVIQVYENCVFMDFDRAYMEAHGHGQYEPLDPGMLPNLFVAYRTKLAEGSEVFHNDIRERWLAEDPDVHQAMHDFADYAQQVRDLLSENRGAEIGPWLNRNFDRRKSISKQSAANLELVERARGAGACCKFSGSGGAIIGVYEDQAMYERLVRTFENTDTGLFKPQITKEGGHG